MPPFLTQSGSNAVTNAAANAGRAAADAGRTAAEGAKSGAQEAKAGAARLLNDWQDIDLTQIVIIVAGTWALIALVRTMLSYLAKHGPSRIRLYLLSAVPIARLLLLVAAIVWIIPLVFNVTLQNFFVIAGAASVAIGFALKDYASSLIAGIVALFERPYRPGDWVKIGDDYGEVRNVGMRALQLVTPDDNVVTVPHDRLWEDNVSNANDGAHTLMCVASFHLEPAHDAGAVRALLTDVALASAFLDTRKPVAVQLVSQPWGTHYMVKAYPFDMRDQFSFVSDMVVRGKAALAASSVEEVAVGIAERT